MNLDTDVVKKRLYAFDFKQLFRELGWDPLAINPVPITVDHEEYLCTPVKEKHGAQVYLCTTVAIPRTVLRHKIDNQLTRHAREHLLIFADIAQSRQVWQWAEHTLGQPHFLRSYEWHKGQVGGILIQRLAEIAIPISEEESIDLTTVRHRLKDAFDRDRVTKRFYELFEKQRQRFQKSLHGLPDEDASKWYSSVVVNRLMFIYFLQKQGFLDHGDRDYLRKKLEFIQWKGPDHYYRNFLLPLFFDGFAKSERSGDIRATLGDVPYLNGGLFAPHVLEEKYGDDIRIADASFTELLDFFDQYQWTLDDRPLANDNEINPDVLGYIFEQYVNQKQMGAYYTKEDITGYIGQEAIIPRLFDMVKAKYKPAFSGGNSVFSLLKCDPDTYIYASMCKGAWDADGNTISLPANIACGISDVNRRGEWNKAADPRYALPTETWREVVARVQRCEEVRRHLTDGDVTDINDLITYNLDIRQFAQDAISQSEDPVFVLRFFEALRSITILDPTCGSGAFLFAALNILERLYEACLQRMEQFQHDGVAYQGQQLRAVEEFNGILKEADSHLNRRYHTLKSIVAHNLFGVDIMEEAVEICKLRLFLRLVAELNPDQPVEPLPDIDFNVKVGNTLVGYSTLGQARITLGSDVFEESVADEIEQDAAAASRHRQYFIEKQKSHPELITRQDKKAVEDRLNAISLRLNHYMARQYQVDPDKSARFDGWKKTHRPFHWFVEFFDPMEGHHGFDVVLGNPPYIRASQVREQYNWFGSETESCPDIYADVVERGCRLLNPEGRLGMIVPISLSFSDDFQPLRKVLAGSLRQRWYSNYARIPAALFSADVRVRNTIVVGSRRADADMDHVTVTHRWFEEYRPYLLSGLRYSVCNPQTYNGRIPKFNAQRLADAFESLQHRSSKCVGDYLVKHTRLYPLGYKKSAYNWLCFCMKEPPCYDAAGKLSPQTQYGLEYARDASTRNVLLLLLNGKIMYAHWVFVGDDFHVTQWMFATLPFDLDCLSRVQRSELDRLALELDRQMKENLVFKLNAGKRVGSYNLARCRSVTDQSDAILARAMGLDGAWDDIELLYAQTVKTNFADEDTVE